MKIALFDTHRFERPIFESLEARFGQELTFLEPKLNEETAKLAAGFPAVCAFVNDRLNAAVLSELHAGGVKLIALRSAGYNHVDLPVASALGITVVRVPAYSPYAVAEHAVALMMAINRKLCRASARIHDLNFSLEGLVGFDMHGKTVGIIGTGKIGSVMASILKGFGCEILAYDPFPDSTLVARLGVRYVSLEELYRNSDIITLHLPLSPTTQHLIDANAFSQMKKTAMLINTGRGGLIDTQALINALKCQELGSAGLDVYEEEETIFSRDLSESVLKDDVLARLMTFPNVLITAHQAFLTHEALHNIAETTLENVRNFEQGQDLKNEVHARGAIG
ncbi:MAG: 2-hydroxyacid dehydrogenase [Methylotenera sp.]|nr:2-hydroxyacid dehydrogenase [Oligoflexia bacterium]